jgi:hypothetical protein
MKKTLALSAIAVLVTGCMTPGGRYGHSREPINLGGGQFLVEGYKLETGLERAREYCGSKEMVTTNIRPPIKEFEWTKITFFCR